MAYRQARSSLRFARASAVTALLALAAEACGSDPATPACASGTICTWAGNGDPAFYGDGLDRREAMLYMPMDLAFAPDGRAYVLDWQNHRVRRVELDGTVQTVLGTGDVGDGPDTGDERTDPGVAGTACNLNHPTDVTFDGAGNVVIAAWHNHKVRRLDPATGMEAVVSGAGPGFSGDGAPALAALLNQPKSVVVSRATNAIYVADTRNFRVRRIDGHGDHHHRRGRRDGGIRGRRRPARARRSSTFRWRATIRSPAEGWRSTARIASTSSTPRTSASGGWTSPPTSSRPWRATARAGSPGDGGPATEASLAWPRDVAFGPDGRLYIADTDNHRVRAVDLATGVITTVVGDGVARFGGDGGAPRPPRCGGPGGSPSTPAATSTSPTRSTTASGW